MVQVSIIFKFWFKSKFLGFVEAPVGVFFYLNKFKTRSQESCIIEHMKTVRPTVPEQPNKTKSGLFLLHYMGMILRNLDQWKTTYSVIELKDWFRPEDLR